MLSTLKKYLSPPVFPEDEDKTRAAFMLNVLLLGALAATALLGFAVVFIFVEKVFNTVFILFMALVFIVCYRMMRRGRVLLASTVAMSCSWIVITVFIALAGGMSSISVVFYVMSTVLTGLMLGTRIALIYVGASSIAGIVMIVLSNSPHAPPRIFPIPPIAGWLDLTLSLLLSVVAIDLALRSLRKALAQARFELEERKKTARELLVSEQQLKKALEEKETLLYELYHRTENNMGVICALLDLQAGYLSDKAQVTAFTDIKNRIHSMALVHQKLYQAQDLSRINLKEYITELAQLLMESYQISMGRICLVLDAEDVTVLIDTAVPCGLILNELISNVLKHAFPGNRDGEIRIRLQKISAHEILLEVSDNGVGVPASFDFKKNIGFGLRNIFIICEKQLRGSVAFSNVRGVTCRMQFRDDLYTLRV